MVESLSVWLDWLVVQLYQACALPRSGGWGPSSPGYSWAWLGTWTLLSPGSRPGAGQAPGSAGSFLTHRGAHRMERKPEHLGARTHFGFKVQLQPCPFPP